MQRACLYCPVIQTNWHTLNKASGEKPAAWQGQCCQRMIKWTTNWCVLPLFSKDFHKTKKQQHCMKMMTQSKTCMTSPRQRTGTPETFKSCQWQWLINRSRLNKTLLLQWPTAFSLLSVHSDCSVLQHYQHLTSRSQRGDIYGVSEGNMRRGIRHVSIPQEAENNFKSSWCSMVMLLLVLSIAQLGM